jgi:hypothetical protein
MGGWVRMKGWHKDRKEKFMSAPSIHPSIHVGALGHAGTLLPAHLYFTRYQFAVDVKNNNTIAQKLIKTCHKVHSFPSLIEQDQIQPFTLQLSTAKVIAQNIWHLRTKEN